MSFGFQIKLLKNLEAYLKEEDPDIAITVRKYAALSMFEVFNHLIPTFELGEETKDHKSLCMWFVLLLLIISLISVVSITLLYRQE